MSFLHLSLLGGAALVAVPIILHLVMRRQPKHLEFPALRFIRQREHANRRKLKLRHLLLLALRCAVIALLAAALAQPAIKASGLLGDQQAPAAVALVFDISPRMLYRDHNLTRIEAAQETALWLVPRLPPDSDVAVLDARTSSAVFAVDRGAARERIERLEATPTGLPLAALVDDAVRLVAGSEKTRKEVYVFTDLARSTWTPEAIRQLHTRLEEFRNVAVYVIDVGVEHPHDFALGDLRLSAQMLSRNNPLRVGVDVASTGAAGERAVELHLVDEAGGDTVRGQQTVTLKEDSAQQIEFRLAGLATGYHQGYLKIVGQDALACDDLRYFTVAVKPAWRVLVAAPNDPADHALFLTEALAPYPLRAKGEAAFECDTISLDALAKRDLAPYAAVCLLDPAPLPDETWKKLAAYAAGGKGVAICLGRNAQPDAFNTPAAQELLPSKLVRQWRAGERDWYLAPDNLQHPVLAKFRPLETSVPWDAFPVMRHWEFGPLAAGSSTIIAYSNKQPALVEKPLGKGRVLVMTTPISDAANRRDVWNLLPTGDEPWPFVILANEMLYYLVGSGETRLNYYAGDTVILPLGPRDYRASFLLAPPKGDPIRQSVDEKQSLLVVSVADELGNYQASAGGKTDGVRLGFSVNLPRERCLLDRIQTDELKSAMSGTEFRLARNREEIDRNVSTARVGRELYPFLIVLVALILAAEQIVSNLFYRGDQLRGGPPSARELITGKKDSPPVAAATNRNDKPTASAVP